MVLLALMMHSTHASKVSFGMTHHMSCTPKWGISPLKIEVPRGRLIEGCRYLVGGHGGPGAYGRGGPHVGPLEGRQREADDGMVVAHEVVRDGLPVSALARQVVHALGLDVGGRVGHSCSWPCGHPFYAPRVRSCADHRATGAHNCVKRCVTAGTGMTCASTGATCVSVTRSFKALTQTRLSNDDGNNAQARRCSLFGHSYGSPFGPL